MGLRCVPGSATLSCRYTNQLMGFRGLTPFIPDTSYTQSTLFAVGWSLNSPFLQCDASNVENGKGEESLSSKRSGDTTTSMRETVEYVRT